jgi:hypothetical protein
VRPGPTFEGHLLRSEITLEELEPLPDGGLLDERIFVSARAAMTTIPVRSGIGSRAR